MILRLANRNLNHTGIYVYAKGKTIINLTLDYLSDYDCHTLGKYLRYHRTFQDKSTREVAESVGIVPATLVLYENDKHPIKYNTVVQLAQELNIDFSRLLDSYTLFVDYPYGEFLKEARKGLPLSQAAIANDIGVSQSAYSGQERGTRVPRRQEYQNIVSALQKRKLDVGSMLFNYDVPYVQENCTLGVSDNVINCGHHMNDGFSRFCGWYIRFQRMFTFAALYILRKRNIMQI